ncbi:MAG TPA: hypothetical protein VMT29_07685 [Steroidobacteraceae bacterium]|nr:hypothetical protein [Steroidobacteraceae bacterium]
MRIPDDSYNNERDCLELAARFLRFLTLPAAPGVYPDPPHPGRPERRSHPRVAPAQAATQLTYDAAAGRDRHVEVIRGLPVINVNSGAEEVV